MSKIETTSKVSLKLSSRINLGRQGARTELSTLDTAHKSPHIPEKAIPDQKEPTATATTNNAPLPQDHKRNTTEALQQAKPRKTSRTRTEPPTPDTTHKPPHSPERANQIILSLILYPPIPTPPRQTRSTATERNNAKNSGFQGMQQH